MILLPCLPTDIRLVVTANRRDFLETCNCGATHGGNAAQEATVLRRFEAEDRASARITVKIDIGPSGGPSAYPKKFAAYFAALRFDAVEPLLDTDVAPSVAPIGGRERNPRAALGRFGALVLFRIRDASPADLRALKAELGRVAPGREAVAVLDHASDVDSLRAVLGSAIRIHAAVARDATKRTTDASGTLILPPPYQSEVLSIFLSASDPPLARKTFIETTEKEDSEAHRVIHEAG